MAFVPFVPLDNNIADAGDLVSVEAFRGIADSCNYIIDSVPVGETIMVLTGMPGVPTPDPRIWQLCDGSLITNQNSPLRNTNTPDYTSSGTYMKTTNSLGAVGTIAGSNTISISHNHGGSTSSTALPPDNGDEEAPDYYTVYSHAHSIENVSQSFSSEPVHIRINHYIKIF